MIDAGGRLCWLGFSGGKERFYMTYNVQAWHAHADFELEGSVRLLPEPNFLEPVNPRDSLFLVFTSSSIMLFNPSPNGVHQQ